MRALGGLTIVPVNVLPLKVMGNGLATTFLRNGLVVVRGVLRQSKLFIAFLSQILCVVIWLSYLKNGRDLPKYLSDLTLHHLAYTSLIYSGAVTASKFILGAT